MKNKSKNAERNEDDMASRLQLELGKQRRVRLSPGLISHKICLSSAAEEQARKKNPNKGAHVDIFRGVSFQNWLYLFIKVRYCFHVGGFCLTH